MVFRNNDLPGIMLGSGAQRLMRLYGVAPGRRAVVATANEHGYEVALDLLDAGVEVAAIVELRHETPRTSRRRCGAGPRHRRSTQGTTIAEALGNGHVTGVRIAAITGEARYERERARHRVRLRADQRRLCAGRQPRLLRRRALRLRRRHARCIGAVELPQGVVPAGSVNGVWRPRCGAGRRPARRLAWRRAMLGRTKGEPPPAPADRAREPDHPSLADLPAPAGQGLRRFRRGPARSRTFGNAVLDGYDDVQLLKRYSTLGMGPSQGRHSNVAAIRLLAEADGPRHRGGRHDHGAAALHRGEVRRTSPGAASTPCATPPMHHRHLELGARMMVGRRLAAPGLLRRQGGRRGADRGGSPQLPRQRRPDRRLDARRLRHPRARCRRVRAAACTPGPISGRRSAARATC